MSLSSFIDHVEPLPPTQMGQCVSKGQRWGKLCTDVASMTSRHQMTQQCYCLVADQRGQCVSFISFYSGLCYAASNVSAYCCCTSNELTFLTKPVDEFPCISMAICSQICMIWLVPKHLQIGGKGFWLHAKFFPKQSATRMVFSDGEKCQLFLFVEIFSILVWSDSFNVEKSVRSRVCCCVVLAH